MNKDIQDAYSYDDPIDRPMIDDQRDEQGNEKDIQVKQFRMFEVRYFEPSLNQSYYASARFKIIDTSGNRQSRILTASNRKSQGSVLQQAVAWIESFGIEVVGYSSTHDKGYIFTTDFKTRISKSIIRIPDDAVIKELEVRDE